VESGVNKRRIKGALNELQAAGFLTVAQPGRRLCGADKGAPGQYELTWLPVIATTDLSPASNRWRKEKPCRSQDIRASGARLPRCAAGPCAASTVRAVERRRARRTEPIRTGSIRRRPLRNAAVCVRFSGRAGSFWRRSHSKANSERGLPN
jgi:hypothetical protein